MLKNLRQWFGSTQQTEPIDAGPTDPKQQFSLADRYYLGYYDQSMRKFFDPNENEAIKWYNKSAEQGNEYAQVALAHLHMEGKGLPKDPTEGVRCYVRLAKQGYKPATEWLNKHNMKPLN